MSKRCENGYFALVLACLVGLTGVAYGVFTVAYSKGYQRADQEHAAYYAERATTEKAYHECLNGSATLDAARKCITYSPHRTRESERAEQDLNAQREMAQWAEGMLWASWVIGVLSLLVASLGAFYVYLTLNETRRIGRAQVRAYLSVSGVKLTPTTLTFLDFELKNSGQSPAVSVSACIVMEVTKIKYVINQRGKKVKDIDSIERITDKCFFTIPDIPANSTNTTTRGMVIPVCSKNDSSEELRYRFAIALFWHDVFDLPFREDIICAAEVPTSEVKSNMDFGNDKITSFDMHINQAAGSECLTDDEIRECKKRKGG